MKLKREEKSEEATEAAFSSRVLAFGVVLDRKVREYLHERHRVVKTEGMPAFGIKETLADGFDGD